MIRAVIDLNVIISGVIVPRGFAYHAWAADLVRASFTHSGHIAVIW